MYHQIELIIFDLLINCSTQRDTLAAGNNCFPTTKHESRRFVLITILFILAGFVLLYFGAEFLVRGSSQLALRFGISPLVVGLTVVAFGTSAPEMVVSVTSGLKGLGDVAIGNVVGSNIFNVAVILGISALICPIKVNMQVLRIDAPIAVGLSLLLLLFLGDHTISRPEGLLLTLGIIGYVTFTILYSRRHPGSIPTEELHLNKKESSVLDVLRIAGGLVGLIIGSNFFVKGAVDCATYLHVSEAVIGLTIVALGTSLPELATSLVAALKKQEDIAIGNIIGSNIFNILSILGISGLIAPLHAQGITMLDLSFMVGSAVLLVPLMISGFRLGRFDGVLLLSVYGVYLFLLWPKG